MGTPIIVNPGVSCMQCRECLSGRDNLCRRYAILGGDWSPFWHDLIDLLGMENLYYRMHDQPALVDALLSHMVDYYAEVSRRIFRDGCSEYFINRTPCRLKDIQQFFMAVLILLEVSCCQDVP